MVFPNTIKNIQHQRPVEFTKKIFHKIVHHSNQVEMDWLCGGGGGRIVSYTEQ